MLDLRRASVPLLLSCLIATSATADVTRSEKLRQAKRLDVDGYSPVMAKAVTVDESEPNDGASLADAIGVGDVVNATFQVAGDEDWFRVTTTSEGYLRITTSSLLGSLSDTVIEVYDASSLERVGYDDDGGLGLFSSVDHVPVPADADVLVRVWNFEGTGGDAYQLVAEAGTPPPPAPINDGVAAAEFVGCNKASIGSTVGSRDSLDSVTCLTIETAGGDVFYRVVLPYSNQLNAQVNPLATGFDPSLVLFTDPGDPSGSCLVASDIAFAGEAEAVVYTNEDFENGLEIFIAVDSWAPSSAGDFVLDVRCDFVVPVETSNWSTLKASW